MGRAESLDPPLYSRGRPQKSPEKGRESSGDDAKHLHKQLAIIYLRNPMASTTLGLRDRPETGARRYLARFFGFFCGALPCGFGGVLSILRSTSSGFWVGLGSCLLMVQG